MNDATRRDVILGASAALAATAMTRPGLAAARASETDLTWMPAWRLRELMVAKKVSPIEVTDHFLKRTEDLNPKLHAFSTIDLAGARDQARKAEAAIMAGQKPGLLFGVPVAVKENIPVRGLPLRREPPLAVNDAILVERLRAAGAIIVGKTIMPGMGNYAASLTSYGVESSAAPDRAPRNPWDLGRVPGSSSAGSAAAAAAAMTPITIGGDGGGSTRLPAALCGVMGVHPSRGRIAKIDYRVPRFLLTKTNGPIGRDARDVTLTMQAIAGPDGRDFICIDEPAPDYLATLVKNAGGVRIAWTDDFGYGDLYANPQARAVIDAVRKSAFRLVEIGAVIEPIQTKWEDFWESYLFTSRQYPETEGYEGALPLPPADPDKLERALGVRNRSWVKFNDVLATHDIIMSPTIDFTAPTVEEWDAAWNKDGQKYPHGTYAPIYTCNTFMFNWIGWPAVSVPCGYLGGLPIALQLATCPSREAMLFQVAHAFMEAFPNRQKPTAVA